MMNLDDYDLNDTNSKPGILYYIIITLAVIICSTTFAFITYKIVTIPNKLAEITYNEIEPVDISEDVKVNPVIDQDIDSDLIQELNKPIVYCETAETTEEAETANDINYELIARVVWHEAGNQEMIGKVAVAAAILNRCEYYNLTVEEVVYAKDQFASPVQGEIPEDIIRAVEIAKENRDLFPRTMMWFRTENYHGFGTPYLIIQDHYFSYLEE